MFVRQGHYALDPKGATVAPQPDRTLERIGDLKTQEFSALLPA
jgi:hypothetical protein